MLEELQDLYQQVILDHSRSPRNYGVLSTANRKAQGLNPLCGDSVTLYVKVENGRVEEVMFQGAGCAISKASASLLTESVKGKTPEEVRALFARVHEMVTTGKAGSADLGKLAVFTGVHKYPARVKCAILPWHAMLAALEGKDEKVSTE
ncbi:MAG: SUF system NifU family Fe-S cluster assembly protein [Verrucomicrobiae bacterium]|nr:SUF system NifU family Fe-S cluster assembly protein [Verrucomicrobiae bacterium]